MDKQTESCTACPGQVAAPVSPKAPSGVLPCSGHGNCTKNGTCICDAGYKGAICDHCISNYHEYHVDGGSGNVSTVCLPCATHNISASCSGHGQCVYNASVSASLAEPWSDLNGYTGSGGGGETEGSSSGDERLEYQCVCEGHWDGNACGRCAYGEPRVTNHLHPLHLSAAIIVKHYEP